MNVLYTPNSFKELSTSNVTQQASANEYMLCHSHHRMMRSLRSVEALGGALAMARELPNNKRGPTHRYYWDWSLLSSLLLIRVHLQFNWLGQGPGLGIWWFEDIFEHRFYTTDFQGFCFYEKWLLNYLCTLIFLEIQIQLRTELVTFGQQALRFFELHFRSLPLTSNRFLKWFRDNTNFWLFTPKSEPTSKLNFRTPESCCSGPWCMLLWCESVMSWCGWLMRCGWCTGRMNRLKEFQRTGMRLCGDTGLPFQFLSIFSALVRRVVTPQKKVTFCSFWVHLGALNDWSGANETEFLFFVGTPYTGTAVENMKRRSAQLRAWNTR